MDMDFDSGQGDDGNSSPRVSRASLKRAGWREVRAFVEPSEQPTDTMTEKQKPQTDAERKASQRKRQIEDGLKQINVVAPEDDDARALLIQVAKAVRSKAVRRDISAILADRALVKIGRKFRRLRGGEADQARVLLKL